MPADPNPLAALLQRFASRRVLVLGDLVADEFIYGEMKRVWGDIARTSREVAFGLVLREREVQRVPGGGANAVNNLVALGARPLPFGFVGDDEAGRRLRRHLQRAGVKVGGIRVLRGRATTTKARILAGSPQSTAQQVLRLDREETEAPPATAARHLLAAARRALPHVDAILVSDYGYGAATPALLARLLAGRRVRVPVVVDSRFRLRAYRRMTATTPSVPELEETYHCQIGGDARLLARLGRRLLGEVRAAAVLVTRGRHGMLLVEKGKKTVSVPSVGGDQVTDVTGAGDTVAAVFTLALAAGANFAQAAQLANYAAGRVVQKRGTATVSRAELLAAVNARP
ncbi:MAG: bifunctional heptose 7-phosphate kinase/heptose 1-phosphate adenyltransferase [Terriglobia bacterium]